MTTANDPTPVPTAAMLGRQALVFGGSAGAIASLWLLLEYAFGFHGDNLAARQYSTMFSFAVPIAAISLGVMRWRDRGLGGSIRFTQAFSCALAIGFVHALVFAVFSFFYVAAINPGFIAGLVEFQVAAMEAAGATAADVTAFRDSAAQHATPSAYAFAVFAQTLLSTFIIALFASVVMRRKS